MGFDFVEIFEFGSTVTQSEIKIAYNAVIAYIIHIIRLLGI